MSKQFYVILGTQKIGPFSAEALINQNIPPDTLVWSSGMDDWAPAGNVPELQGLFKQNRPIVTADELQKTAINTTVAAETNTEVIKETVSSPPPVSNQASNNNPKKRLFLVITLLVVGLAGAFGYYKYAIKPTAIVVDTLAQKRQPSVILPHGKVDFKMLSKEKLDTIRNTIYARRGYSFKNKAWAAYFKNQGFQEDSIKFQKTRPSASEQDSLNALAEAAKR